MLNATSNTRPSTYRRNPDRPRRADGRASGYQRLRNMDQPSSLWVPSDLSDDWQLLNLQQREAVLDQARTTAPKLRERTVRALVQQYVIIQTMRLAAANVTTYKVTCDECGAERSTPPNRLADRYCSTCKAHRDRRRARAEAQKRRDRERAQTRAAEEAAR